MHALVRFAQIPPANTFSTGEIYPHVIAALSGTAEQCSLASLRYDLSKLRAKGLVEKLPRSRRYRLPAEIFGLPDLLETLPGLRSAERCSPPPCSR